MPPVNSWLSFSFPPVDILRSCHSQIVPTKFMPAEISSDSSQQCIFDSLNVNEWPNFRALISGGEEIKEETQETKPPPIADFSIPASINSEFQQPMLKMEDFLKGYSEEQDLNTFAPTTAGFQASSSNSVSGEGNKLLGRNISGHDFDFSRSPCTFSLAVSSQRLHKTVVIADSKTPKKTTDTFGQRTSFYRGVTRHRWTGRYEAHLWDNSCRREGQSRKGRQVYLGGYDKEEKAAKAYDLAALKYWSSSATTNYPVSNYTQEIEEMKNMTKQEFIASLRRKSSGFSRGASIYRGVTRHHQQGRWQARIGRVAGNKDLYLGTFGTQEEAAEAYDIAAIKFRGANAVTNFEINRYNIDAIANTPLPIGPVAKRLKLSLQPLQNHNHDQNHHHLKITDGSPVTTETHATPISFGQPNNAAPLAHNATLLAPNLFHNLFQLHPTGEQAYNCVETSMPELCERSLYCLTTNTNSNNPANGDQPWNM
ncbi:APETALA2-like protein 2 [Tasmannia lanceolata]|uniref:APETALA2-like protein 2 n=1 Tax=Tasmannia lanceolata TaxID=3420 RepID=UPI004063DA56